MKKVDMFVMIEKEVKKMNIEDEKFMEDDDLKDEALAIAKFESQQKAKKRKYEQVLEALKRVNEEIRALEDAKNVKKAKIKSLVIKFYQKKYPNEDINWLENLTEKQYDEIFDKLLNDESLDEIKQVIVEK